MMRILLLVLLLIIPSAARAVQPDEILKDPALEARARHISAGLRCLVCQNQSIDESDATVARDLRILIREQLLQNKSDDDVINFVVERYGEFVLLKPRLRGETLVLWLTPFVILAGAIVLLLRRRPAKPEQALTPEERAEIAALLKKETGTATAPPQT